MIRPVLVVGYCCVFVLCSAVPTFGGSKVKTAYAGWLGVWRELYKEQETGNETYVPELPDSKLPSELHGVPVKVVLSAGGAAGGVVTEGMGYGLLLESFEALRGNAEALSNGKSLMKAWLGMVYGPTNVEHPLGGGIGSANSSTDKDVWPYGVSAIEDNGTYAGVAAWKYPYSSCSNGCQGSATDGDEDAALGMINLALALGEDVSEGFLSVVTRVVLSFASADLGFPGLYRVVGKHQRVFIPKGGSQWGGLLPGSGKSKSSQQAWCYNPSYFAPGHYRAFRDFAKNNSAIFNKYLSQTEMGTLDDLVEAFDGAVIGGYNMLYHSSCLSGSVANWVGSEANCTTEDELACRGVPWKYTPYLGSNKGTCTASGTSWGKYGADACRTPWRVAMDYVMFEKEATNVHLYDTEGNLSTKTFNAQVYLDRFMDQYKNYSQCDGGQNECIGSDGTVETYKLAPAFAIGTPNLVCDNVPNSPQGWWAKFMAYPTFTAFVAESAHINATERSNWMELFGSMCTFVDGIPDGNMCSKNYFDAGQEVISFMVLSGVVQPYSQAASSMII